MSPEPCFPPHHLSMLVDSRLGPDEEEEICRHLDHCTACRGVLDKLAEPGAWEEMRGFLGSGSFDERGFALGPAADPAPPESSPLGFLAPSDDPAVLGKVGPYEVTGVVGRGGMSVVLKAFDRPLNRNVAIKVLAPQLAASSAARRRFAREARAAAGVVHDHVIPIHAVADHHGLPYLVMPYYPARSLQHRIDETGALSVAEALRVARQVAAGLAAAHVQGLVHRDVKPANILLENDVERAVVTDFGLARAADDASLTCSGTIAGTPQYMAPEQAQGDAADHRADLFSLGSVVYTMCAGRPPFRADTALGVLRRVCEEEPRPLRDINPDVPEWLADAVARLHAKDPADRFQSADEVGLLFERGLAHIQSPTSIPAPPCARRGGRSGGRLAWRRIAVAIVIAVASSGGLAWLSSAGLRAVPDRRQEPVAAAGGATHQPAATAPADSIPSGVTDPEIARFGSALERIEAGWSAPAGENRSLAGDIARLRARVERLADP